MSFGKVFSTFFTVKKYFRFQYLFLYFQTPKDNQTRPVLIRESTVESEVSIESGFSTGSTLSTPTHQNIPTRNSTTVAGSPGLKILPNGIGKDNHKISEK